MSYTRFRRTLHRRAAPPPAIALRLIHPPGERVQVDYCDGITVVEPETGEVRKTQFFCGVLPFSSYTFGEFVSDQKLPTFIECYRARRSMGKRTASLMGITEAVPGRVSVDP